MGEQTQWQLSGNAPEAYEHSLVPVIFAPWAAVLIDRAALQPGERVLDVACGTGVVARLAAPQVGTHGQVTGLDLNPGMLAVARSLPPVAGAAIDWREGSAVTLPFAEACRVQGICGKRAAMANPTTQELEATFHTWKDALNTGDLNTFWQAIDERAEILDEDYPWRMSKEDFVDHLNFHAGEHPLWESFEWRPRELHFLIVGDTGHVSGFATFRGKPRDAGFRQRFMGFTQTWVRQAGTWQLLCWHQSPLLGRIVGASPS